MAFHSGSEGRVYLDFYNLSPYLNNVSVTRNRDLTDVSCLGDGNRDFFPTISNASCTVSGFLDSLSGASEPALRAAFEASSSEAVSIFYNTDAIGSRGVCGSGWTASYEASAPVDGVQAVAADFQFTGQVDACVSLHALGTETTTGTYTSVDNTAATTNGAVANLHVTAAGATGTGTVLIQDSADNMTFATIITFANFTTTTSETKTYSGTVRRYVRANLSSARNTQTFVVAFGRRP